MSQERLDRERHTIEVMIGVYCRGKHRTRAGLCDECRALHAYAMQRIAKCPYGEDKPTCAKCPIHCYKPAMRDTVRAVMRYSGPRMMLYHPWLTVLHYRDEWARARQKRLTPRRETSK